MKRFFRYALLVFAWLFLAAIVAQVYFAGLMLFGQEGGRCTRGAATRWGLLLCYFSRFRRWPGPGRGPLSSA